MENPILIFLAIAVLIIAVAIFVSRLFKPKPEKPTMSENDKARREGRLLSLLAALHFRKKR